MKPGDYQKLLNTLRPHLWYPVLILYGRYSERVVSAKKLLEAAGIEYQVRSKSTERIGGPGAPATIPVPDKDSSINPESLPDVNEITFYVRGKDVTRAKRLLAKVEEKQRATVLQWILRILGISVFLAGAIAVPFWKHGDILLFLGVGIFGISFIKRKEKFEPGKYTFVTCPVCKRINHVELERFDKALCGGCKVKLSKVLRG